MSAKSQHSFGIQANASALISFNRSIDHYLIGFEKNVGAYYRFEPEHNLFGLHAALGWDIKNYHFRYDPNGYRVQTAVLLRQRLVMASLQTVIKLKNNGARLLFGFNAGFMARAQTEVTSQYSNTTYYYSDDALNALQHTNSFQVDACIGVDQPIGLKQKFMVGLALNQNINRVLSADFVYPYYNSTNRLTYLHVSKNLYPIAASLVLRYRIN